VPTSADLLAQARAKHDLAKRARRFAGGLLGDADRSRLLRHATELEAEASDLERKATTQQVSPPIAAHPVVQQQVQQQQQAEVTPSADNENKKPEV
jgi:hypothetical protein